MKNNTTEATANGVTRRTKRGTVDGHPHLSKTLQLSEEQQSRLEAFAKMLGPIATRGELKAANKKQFGMKASPTYITKNVAFKIAGVRGLYSLVAQKGTPATKDAVRKYMEAKEKASGESAPSKKPAKVAKKAAKKVAKKAAKAQPSTQPAEVTEATA